MPQSFSYENSRNDRSRDRPYWQYQQQIYKQSNYQQNKHEHFYQNKQQQQFIGKQQQITSKSRTMNRVEDVITVPPKRGKWIWVDDKEGK